MMYEKIVNKFVEQSAHRVVINKDDYIKDGLLSCGKCHKPKQCKVKLGKKIIKPYIDCDCEKAKKENKKKALSETEFKAKSKENKRLCFGSADFSDKTFKNDNGNNPYVSSVAKKYVENFEEFKSSAKGLIFFGDCSSGKTFFAACIVNALLDNGYRCIMTNFPKIINQMLHTKDVQGVINQLIKYDLIVLDDLGVEPKTEFATAQVYNVVDSLDRAKKTMVITTNYTSDEIKNPVALSDKRLMERIKKCCFPVEVKGSNQREKILIDDFNKMKNTLGLRGTKE